MAYAQAARIKQSYNDYESFRTTDRVLFTLEAMRDWRAPSPVIPAARTWSGCREAFPVQIEPDPASTDPSAM